MHLPGPAPPPQAAGQTFHGAVPRSVAHGGRWQYGPGEPGSWRDPPTNFTWNLTFRGVLVWTMFFLQGPGPERQLPCQLGGYLLTEVKAVKD